MLSNAKQMNREKRTDGDNGWPHAEASLNKANGGSSHLIQIAILK